MDCSGCCGLSQSYARLQLLLTASSELCVAPCTTMSDLCEVLAGFRRHLTEQETSRNLRVMLLYQSIACMDTAALAVTTIQIWLLAVHLSQHGRLFLATCYSNLLDMTTPSLGGQMLTIHLTGILPQQHFMHEPTLWEPDAAQRKITAM